MGKLNGRDRGMGHGDVVHARRPEPVVTPAEPQEAASSEPPAGRGDAAQSLLARWSPDARDSANVSIVAGVAGAGKSTLVRHACAVAARRAWFSGGAVAVDMRGYEPEGDRVPAAAVFVPLLRALGAIGRELPAAEAEQAALYHQLLDLLARRGRRVLLALHNVSSADQIRELVPRQPAHKVVVTTRASFPVPGSHVLELDVLSVDDASDLLRRAVDHDNNRIGAGSGAAERLVRSCGRLPLAVTIAAGVLAGDAALTPAELAAELENATAGEGVPAVAAVFESAWRRLRTRDPAAAGLLRLLTLIPGPGVSTDAAAALSGQAPAAAWSQLTALHRARLLQRAGERWRLHDLIRLQAGVMPEPSSVEDGDPAALGRLVEYYLHSVTVAAGRLDSEPTEAADWFTRERPNILGAISLAAAAGLHRDAITLAESVLTHFLVDRCELGPAIALAEQAHGEARQLGDPQTQVAALRRLATLLMEGGRLDEAIAIGRRAVEVGRATGDPEDEPEALLLLGQLLFRDRRLDEAAATYRRALEASRSAELECRIAGFLFEPLSAMGRHEDAISAVRQGIVVARSHGDQGSEGLLLTNLGAAFAMAGRREAIATLELAAEVCRSAGDQESEAHAWGNLAVLHAQLAGQGKALAALRNAFAIYLAIGRIDGADEWLAKIGSAFTQSGGAAAVALREAVEICRAAGDGNAEGRVRFRLGSLLNDTRQFDAGCTELREAADLWGAAGNRRRQGIALAALARALVQSGHRTAAERAADDAIEALLDGGDPKRAVATQEWLDMPSSAKSREPPEPWVSSAPAEISSGGWGGCYTVLTLVALPFLYAFAVPWWILAGWAVLAPFLESVAMVTFHGSGVQKSADISAEQIDRMVRPVKRLVFVALVVTVAVTLVVGGPWWPLALCTVSAVIGVDGKAARLMLYATIGGIAAYYTWGTWWALTGMAILIVGVLSPTRQSKRVVRRVDVSHS